MLSSYFSFASLATSRCRSVGFCIELCVVSALNSRAIQSEACISAAKYERSSFFSGSRAEISFTENKMKRKRTDGESVKAVKEQVFLSRLQI